MGFGRRGSRTPRSRELRAWDAGVVFRELVGTGIVLMTALGGSTAAAGDTVITGTATYRERMMLRPGAVLEVTLEDVSRADVRTEVIGRVRIESPTGPPYAFELPYDPARIDERLSYAVRARVVMGDRLLMTTDRAYPVLTRGAGTEVELLLVGVSGRGAAAGPLGAMPARFAGTLSCAGCEGSEVRLELVGPSAYFMRTTHIGETGDGVLDRIGSWTSSADDGTVVLWDESGPAEWFRVVDADTLRELGADGKAVAPEPGHDLRRVNDGPRLAPRLAMRGMYRRSAAGGELEECSTGLRLPVLADGDGAALEKAAAGSRRRPDEAVLVELDGRIELRPLAEGGGLRHAVVVEKLHGAWAGETCGARMVIAELEGNRWALTRLDGEAVVGRAAREPFLYFSREEDRFKGFTGCNTVTGTYHVDGHRMRLDGLAATAKACLEGMDLEVEFNSALGRVRGYRLFTQHLELLDEDDRVVARFESRNLE